ncbi:MAG TPA: hypothetical protein VHX86_15095 [Tepidisphaeraceae bacterium]|jgi:hypothetical protein|nr:hypothetical protein [Tepidisphaeraceae bacterium]
MRRNAIRTLFAWIVGGATVLSAAGCAQYGFDIRGDGGQQALHVGTSPDTLLADDPLRYRMRALDGRLIIWIANPTPDPIELLGDKSSITDPDGIDHPLHDQIIAPLSSIKEVLPPLENSAENPAPGPPEPVNPYQRSGFIPTPDLGAATPTEANSRDDLYVWQWDDESEIRLDLIFQQGQRRFEQRFIIRRVKQ